MSGLAPMTRRGALAGLLAAGAVGASGCGGAQTSGPELVVWHAYRGAEQAALETLARRYEAEQRSHRIRLVAIPYDAFPNKVSVAVPRGNGPDLFIFAHDRVGDWAASGLLEPLGFWATPALMKRFFPTTVDALVADQQLYGLPLAFKTLALYRNTRLAPEAPADTASLIATAQALRAQNPKVWGLGYELDSLYFHAPWLHGFGGAVYQPPPGAPDRLALASPEAVASVAFARRLLHTDKVVPPEATSALITALFRQDELAHVISGPWFRGELAGHDHWAVSPMPRVSETGLPARPFLGVEAALVSALSGQKSAAYAFAHYLTEPDAAALRMAEGGQLVANSEAYARANDPFVQAFRSQVAEAVPLSNRPAMRAVWTPMKRALSQAIVHGAEPKGALEDACAAIERGLR
jgi:maltose-binding protein MalE